MTLRVIQFSTGNVGQHALRHIVEHPDLKLVGVLASSPEKVGRDAANLCGLDGRDLHRRPVGSGGARRGLRRLHLASETRPKQALSEIAAFLTEGTNVVATSLVWLINPDSADSWLRNPLEAACRAGGAMMYVNGFRLQELRRCRITGVSFGFGFTPDQDPPVMFLPGVLQSIWGGPVKHLADCLGIELHEVTSATRHG